MYEVNRSVVIVKPKQPFADWLATLDVEWPQDAPPSLMQLREDCNAFLIPPAEDVMDAKDYIRQHWQDIFEGELADWTEDESEWPAKRTPNIFQQWFEVELHSVLTDLCEDSLDRESFVPIALNALGTKD